MGRYMEHDGEKSPRVNNHSSSSITSGEGDHGADSELQRRLGSRHITMIALGSSIGMGLWLGSGTSLASGGPATMLIGYLISGSMIWSVAHSIGEMAVMYPLPSASVQWSNKFIDPSAGFALGWISWFSAWITIANELQGIVTVLGFWNQTVSTAMWITIFWAVMVLINAGAVNWFAEIEVGAAAIKFGWIFVVIISMGIISAGGAPKGGPIGFKYWTEAPFINGWKGFLSVMPTCIFAISGSEQSGLVAAETRNPRKSVPKAVGSMWMRLALFYILGSLMVTLTVSPQNEDLFGGTGTNASPFVIAYRDAGLMPLAHAMNGIIFLSVLSTGSIAGYAGSRTLFGLAQIGMAPTVMSKADKAGRPWWALVPTLLLGGGLAYLNVTQTGATIFGWFSNLVSLSALFSWGMICLSHIRMRAAWSAQGRNTSDLPWKTWTWPVAAWWGFLWCVFLLVAELYLAIWPLGADPTVLAFLANYISVPIFFILWALAKAYYRGSLLVPLQDIDLDEGRRFYSARNLADAEKGRGCGLL